LGLRGLIPPLLIVLSEAVLVLSAAVLVLDWIGLENEHENENENENDERRRISWFARG
jgi:hypothetical protein